MNQDDVATSGRTARNGLSVPVLAARPEDFVKLLTAAGFAPLPAPNAARLAAILRDRAVSGFVLELDRVLALRGLEREHLRQLAGGFPLLRVRAGNGGPVFLDDQDDFIARALDFTPRRARLYPREPMVRPAEIASRDDAAFADARGVMLLDLSATGARVSGAGPLPAGDVLRLRLSPRGGSGRGAFAAEVRWRERRGDGRHGAGLRFLGRMPA